MAMAGWYFGRWAMALRTRNNFKDSIMKFIKDNHWMMITFVITVAAYYLVRG